MCCYLGKLEEKVKHAIFDYARSSALPNPYGTTRDMWKWPYIINILAKSRKKQTRLSKSIQSRNPEDIPHAFSKKKDARLESAIPIWDISLEEFVKFYVEAYKAKFIDWTNTYPRENEKNPCNKYKRRIPWLYPEDGK